MKTFNDLRNQQFQEDQDLFIALEIVGNIIAFREQKKLSQRELSRLSGVPQKTISRIENGHDIPKISTLYKLLKALDLEITIKQTNKEEAATIQA
ncbi:helix-turn-helix transcriptional regulator [Bacillus sp. FSL M8-0256]|uniref:helix-turn-helix domain-containing protein n=1 Tax=Bacillus TaxID=1386 RepID=UPI0030FA8564